LDYKVYTKNPNTKADVIARWAMGEEPGPYIVDLSPTDYCNLRCRSCWIRNPAYDGKLDSRHYEIPTDRLIELIGEGAALGVAEWEITGGGEPLVRRGVTERLVERIMELGMSGNMTTNGTLFTPDLVERMVCGGWSKVVFSIDGHNEATNDYLRGGRGSFTRSLKGLTHFMEAKQRFKKKEPVIALNVVLSKRNVDHLADIIELATSYGVGMVNFEPITIHSPLGEALALGPSELQRLPEQAGRAAQEAERQDVITNAMHYAEGDLASNANSMDCVIRREVNEETDGEKPEDLIYADPSTLDFLQLVCYEPWYHLVVKVDGQVGPCCIYKDVGINVKDHSLEAIWFGDHFKRIREAIRKKCLPRYCAICNAGQVITNRQLRKEIASYLEVA